MAPYCFWMGFCGPYDGPMLWDRYPNGARAKKGIKTAKTPGNLHLTLLITDLDYRLKFVACKLKVMALIRVYKASLNIHVLLGNS